MIGISRIEPGSRMGQAVVQDGVAHLAGQVGAPGASLAEHARAVLAEVNRLLARAGTTKARCPTA